MTDLPGYDDWKTHNPDDDRCEFCGAHPQREPARLGTRGVLGEMRHELARS
jgi:hypothetical protein